MRGNPTALQSFTLYLSRGILGDGQPYYAYLAVPNDKLSLLKLAEQQGNFQLTDYGEVLAGHIGSDTPAPEVVRKVQEMLEELS